MRTIDFSERQSRLFAAAAGYERDPSLKNALLLHVARLQWSTDQAEIQVKEFLESELKRKHNLDSRALTTLDGGVLSDAEEELICLLLKMHEWQANRKAKGLTSTAKAAAAAVKKETGTKRSAKTLENQYPRYRRYLPSS